MADKPMAVAMTRSFDRLARDCEVAAASVDVDACLRPSRVLET